MSDATQKMSQQAGEAKGHTEEKASGVVNNASEAAHSAVHKVQEAGAQVQAKAQGAADAVKNATGLNK